MTETVPTPAVPRRAATLILGRPAGGSFEILLVKRHGKMGFMAGAHVFPGGRVDDTDVDPDPFRAAAVRETLEEAGVVVDPGSLRDWSWWITPEEEPKRFDTRFFIASCAAGTVAKIDEREAVAFAWLTARDALSAYAAGDIVLAPPTFATLEDLLAFESVEEAAASVSLPLRPICPRILSGDAGMVLVLPGDPLHPVREPAFAHRSRFVLEGNRFISVRG